jgi:hypothetical protein
VPLKSGGDKGKGSVLGDCWMVTTARDDNCLSANEWQ